MIASQPLSAERSRIYAQRSNVIERGHIKRSFQNTDDLHFSLSCSMMVTVHDHITSLFVLLAMCISVLPLLATSEPHIGTVQNHGNYMVAPVDWNDLFCDPCKITHHEATTTHCIPQLYLYDCFKFLSCIHRVVVVVLTFLLAHNQVRGHRRTGLFDIACLNEQSRNNDGHEGSSDGVLSDYPTVHCGIL